MYDDRREHPRFPILLVATAHTANATFEVVCTNVSAGGAFLATRAPVQPGAPVELELKPHGPDGPTVLLNGNTRYLVERGAGSQPGFSVTWTDALCPTSRLALEQVLRDILRVPRFRVVADGLGGRFRFGASMLDSGPEEPARVVFAPTVAASEPTAAEEPESETPAPSAVDDWSFGLDEPAEPKYAAVLLRGEAAKAAGEPEEANEEAEAPRSVADTFDDLSALALSDDQPDDSWAETALDPGPAAEAAVESAPAKAEIESPEAETMELSVAMAAALASGLSEADLPAAPVEPTPAFDWSEFETAASLPEEVTAADTEREEEPETMEVSVARLLAADPTLDLFEPEAAAVASRSAESTSPAASWRLPPAEVEEAPESDDVGFFGGDAPIATPLPDDDYFPESIAEPEPVQRITRNTVMRRLSSGFEPVKSAPPAAPSALGAQPTARRGAAPTGPAAVEASDSATKQTASRPTASVTRSFLAKVSTGEQPVATTRSTRGAKMAGVAPPTETSTYADHNTAAHQQAVQRHTDDLHATVIQAANLHAPTASAPKARPPARAQVEIAESRLSKPLAMVDAGQEVPRVMTESTVAYTRESQAIGPLLHAQTWPIEGDWPEMIPPSLSERYGYLEHIGTGGNGVAYRAVDLHLNRTVVLKFLAQSTMSTELARKYFLREVKLAASLNHPNIVHIYDIGKVDDVLYYAMEYVDGVPLSAYLQVREPIRDWQFLYSAVAQLCDALDHAHSQQILHRDIKPDNVLVAADGVVKLFDFGLARVADEGFGEQSVLIGTPQYMAPEQLMGGRVDHRTDIYALGVMVFRLVTGVLPFQDGNVFAAHAVEPVPDPRMFNPALPAAIVPVIEKAMAKQPSQRYGSSRELAHDLYAALFGSPLG